jgi:hypothetical protein
MSRASPPLRRLAKRITAFESTRRKSADAETTAAFPAGDRLRPHLATLMGHGGFRALLLRSLALAGAEVPWLRAAQVNADGSVVAAPEGPTPGPTPADLAEGRVELLAQLLGLLLAFVGAGLTSRLVREVWPRIPLTDLDFNYGGKNEKPK